MLITALSLLLNVTPANAIIGGAPVALNDQIAKSVVLLYGVKVNKEDPKKAQQAFICSGTILNDQYILTAAHCVLDVERMFVLFTNDGSTSEKMEALFKTRAKVREAVMVNHNIDYPNTDLGQSYPHNDIGIIRYKGGMPAGFKPVTILDPKVMGDYLKSGTSVVIAGFGKQSKDPKTDDSGLLKKIEIPFQKTLAKKDAYVGSPNAIACSGDSGGPAFIYTNGKYYQWGVASRSNCATFSVYTPLTSNFFGTIAKP